MRAAPRIAITSTACRAGACPPAARSAMSTSRRPIAECGRLHRDVRRADLCTVVRAQQRPAPPKGPGLGVPATPAQIASADISIPPDGAGLPEGSGTPAQGGQVYAAKCLACHGPEGAGGINDRLVGGQRHADDAAPVKTIGSYWPYATTVFDLHSSRDAVSRAALADQRRGVRVDGVSAAPQRRDCRRCRDGREDACRRCRCRTAATSSSRGRRRRSRS